eukprot:1157733-Pelagomonas_calceolata.AAC.2
MPPGPKHAVRPQHVIPAWRALSASLQSARELTCLLAVLSTRRRCPFCDVLTAHIDSHIARACCRAYTFHTLARCTKDATPQ